MGQGYRISLAKKRFGTCKKIQFISEGATLSGVEFELVGQGYRISLAKKRFGTGKKYSLYRKVPHSQG